MCQWIVDVRICSIFKRPIRIWIRPAISIGIRATESIVEGEAVNIRTLISLKPIKFVTKTISIGIEPLCGVETEFITTIHNSPAQLRVRTSITIGIDAAKTINGRISSNVWTSICIDATLVITIAITIRISPLCRFGRECILNIPPSVTIGIRTTENTVLPTGSWLHRTCILILCTIDVGSNPILRSLNP